MPHNHLTLCMLKPDVSVQRKVGKVISRIEEAGFAVLLAKLTQLKPYGAREFYKEHEGKPFFEELVHFICSGPVWALVLFKQNSVEDFRRLLGGYDSSKAELGTLRHEFGNHRVLRENAVHGSATPEDAAREVSFFFQEDFRLLNFQEGQSKAPLV